MKIEVLTAYQQLRKDNRARERAARKLCGRRKCRTCDRIILENLDTRREPGIDGGEKIFFKPAGTYGYLNGICTLRCGFAYAMRTAPRSQ